MPKIDEINWSEVSIPNNTSREQIIRSYENAFEDLKKLNEEYKRYFSNKMKNPRVQFMHDNIFRCVNELVSFHENGIIDVQELLQFIANDDRDLFSDVCKFVYQFYAGKPMNSWRLSQFKSLLTYYLCRTGF